MEAIGLNAADLNSFEYYYSRQYDKLLLDTNQYKDREDQFGYTPKTLNLASICFFNENIPLSMHYADSAIAELKLKIIESPDDERYYAALAYAYGL